MKREEKSNFYSKWNWQKYAKSTYKNEKWPKTTFFFLLYNCKRLPLKIGHVYSIKLNQSFWLKKITKFHALANKYTCFTNKKNSRLNFELLKYGIQNPKKSTMCTAGLGIHSYTHCSFAHFAQIKWATVSDLLRSLKTNERPWAIRSGRSEEMSEWVIRSKNVG